MRRENGARFVTISVVSHGHCEHLKRLFADLDAQEDISTAKIVLTLNKPDEKFESSQYANLLVETIHNEMRKGFGANHNAAFQRCDTEFFLILNPDIRLSAKTSLRNLLSVARSQKKSGLFAPKVVNSGGGIEDSVRTNLSPFAIVRRALKIDGIGLGCLSARRKPPFFWVAGMAMLVHAHAFGSVGGFDERYFLYCEDYDLCARLFLSGYAIHCVNEVEFIHDAQRDSHRSREHLKLHLKSLFKVWISQAYWGIVFRR